MGRWLRLPLGLTSKLWLPVLWQAFLEERLRLRLIRKIGKDATGLGFLGAQKSEAEMRGASTDVATQASGKCLYSRNQRATYTGQFIEI